jgi:serine protease AprX
MKGSGTRANALWGKGRRRYWLLLAVAALAASVAAGTTTAPVTAAPKTGFVPASLRDRAKANPEAAFQVIVQASDTSQLGKLGTAVGETQKKHPGEARGLKKKFKLIPSVTVEITGAQLNDLAASDGVIAVTEDGPVKATSYGNPQNWVSTVGAQWGTPPDGTSYPTIAIVDSGVESRSDFGSRLLTQVDFTSTLPNSSGDGLGHGTLVAGLAVGENYGFTGSEPRARIVSLDVLDDTGTGRVSDLLAASDWILENRNVYDIRVANFSLNAGGGVGIANDPLNRAVEQLWLNGIVVVAAAGNYAVGGAESGVGYAPANDPFVITVGASDTNGTPAPSDDFAAPWSAWGTTQEGFRKPELSAPGRFLNGPAPTGSTMYTSNPARKVANGYMWMSGTSFAAPLVAGAAATLLSRHPEWTPDQVKGALMASVHVPAGYTSAGALGVGSVSVTAGIAADGLANPNLGLNRFVVTDPATTLKSFDAAGWASYAATDPAWNVASWSSASWSSASWSSASWSSASWSSASWSSASWSSASWSSASWASMFAAE